MPLSQYSETFYPTDLDVLRNVYDRFCGERGLSPDDTEETEALASEIVRLRLLGIVNQEELYRAVCDGRELRRA